MNIKETSENHAKNAGVRESKHDIAMISDVDKTKTKCIQEHRTKEVRSISMHFEQECHRRMKSLEENTKGNNKQASNG